MNKEKKTGRKNLEGKGKRLKNEDDETREGTVFTGYSRLTMRFDLYKRGKEYFPHAFSFILDSKSLIFRLGKI